MRRRKLLVALAGLALVTAAAAVVLWPEHDLGFTAENCRRVREGMSRADERRASCRVWVLSRNHAVGMKPLPDAITAP
jgi:hypothetical protein